MPAKILGPDKAEEAARLLRQGKLVAFPTDTVYGVAALADDALHSAGLQAFKGGRHEPFSVHLPDAATALKVAAPLSDLEQHAVSVMCPRGVTVIVANGISNKSLGLRVVQHDLGSRFLTLAEGAVVATSANRHGEPPLNTPEQIAELPGVEAVLSAGELPERPASSVVRMLRCGVEVLREGAVVRADLGKLLGRTIEFVCMGNLNRSAFAKGLLVEMQRYDAREVAGFIPAYDVASSGLVGHLQSGSPPSMLKAAQQRHVNLSEHVPRRFKPKSVFDLRVAMGEDIWEDLPGGLHWDVYDPMGSPAKGYVRMCDEVCESMNALLARTAVIRADDAALEARFEKLFSSSQGARQ